MSGTTAWEISRCSFCAILWIVLSVIDTIVNIEFSTVCSRLLRQRVPIRICHCNSDLEGVQIDRIFIVSNNCLCIVLVKLNNLLGDIDTALQSIGGGKIVSHGLYRFNSGNSLAICSICENNIVGNWLTVLISHDHRVMMVCGQFEVIVDLTLFPDIIVAFLKDSVFRFFPSHIGYTFDIITGPSRTFVRYHDTRGDGQIIRFGPRHKSLGIITLFGLSFEFDSKRFISFRVYEIILTVNHEVQCN